MKSFTSFILILSFFAMSVSSLLAVDQYYNFPKQSVKGSVAFEKKRKLCLFPFRTANKEAKFSYLATGLPSVLFSELRNMEYVYVEYPHADIIYHSFGANPEKTLQERVDFESEGYKKKKKDVTTQEDLQDLRVGKKVLQPDKDPRYIKLELKQIFETKAPFFEDAYSLSGKFGCDYTLTGEFSANDQSLKINVELFDEYEGKAHKFSHNTSFVRSYQELSPLGEEIRKYLQGKETTLVQVEVSGVESSLIYLDGIYLGKSPVLDKKFPIGKRELYVFKEGYHPHKQTIYLEAGKSFHTDVKLVKIASSSFLTVNSNEEADVYLGVTHLGKTPIENVPIPVGMNRLRVSKEGFIDSFRGVDAQEGKLSSFDIEMRPGKSEIYYPNKQNVFLDHSYKDFATYSLYGTLLFYAGYLYFNVTANKAREAARPQIQITNYAIIDTMYKANQSEFAGWYLYQSMLINEADSNYWRNKNVAGTLPIENRKDRQLVASPMTIGIGIMLVSAITFYVLGWDNESFDFGFIPMGTGKSSASGATATSTLPESYGYFQYNGRF
ncbi:PEGA domain-containing protein [Leptospira ilyithenensis]|uniref:PEGA domain-containing protein n=1 Tax=Leptospira ilyithenensis TaxID=2484901 RepID=A0A4R9LSK9_9LEPT|nr:PEGA domain-containing protein [Leptospira ilyithenensis]TGN14361.1 PEGA domain-containing protein [Leptospira ilyithenensis]